MDVGPFVAHNGPAAHAVSRPREISRESGLIDGCFIAVRAGIVLPGAAPQSCPPRADTVLADNPQKIWPSNTVTPANAVHFGDASFRPRASPASTTTRLLTL